MRKNERKHTEKNLKKPEKPRKRTSKIAENRPNWKLLAGNGRESPKSYGNFQKRPRCQKTTAIS